MQKNTWFLVCARKLKSSDPREETDTYKILIFTNKTHKKAEQTSQHDDSNDPF